MPLERIFKPNDAKNDLELYENSYCILHIYVLLVSKFQNFQFISLYYQLYWSNRSLNDLEQYQVKDVLYLFY